ncbi:unnamed protein product, partial [marine sediment metagenome]
IIKQFQFIITSRYHSIIHAYKNGVPAIVLGWAVKYEELLGKFSQMDYMVDFRSNYLHKNFNWVVDKMLNNCEREKEKINFQFSKLKKNDIFEEIAQIIDIKKDN